MPDRCGQSGNHYADGPSLSAGQAQTEIDDPRPLGALGEGGVR
jgi:hypothetical protein